MLKREIETGRVYGMKHSSGRITVRILHARTVRHYGHWSGESRQTTHWMATNLVTGRLIEIKSAAKLFLV